MLTSATFVPYEMKTSLVKILSYQDKNLAGLLINPYFKKEMYFSNLTQLLFLIEEMQNSISYPQQAMESRSFSSESSWKPPSETSAPPTCEKILATFKINILFRQNASWQGRIVWLEQAAESQFRSVLELIKLIDSVLMTV